MSPVTQAVVVCGGLGTRLAPVLGDVPKVLAPLGRRPLLAHLLEDLAAGGVTEAILLAGSGGERVRQAAASLAPVGLRVHTEIESSPQGTAGALWGAWPRLSSRFFLVLGDLYTALDWERFGAYALSHGGLGTLLVHRASHPEDSDLVVHDDSDRLIGWVGKTRHKSATLPATGLGNAGVAVFDRALLHRVPRDRPCDLFGQVIPAMVDARAPLFAYRTSEYVRDMGTPERLRGVEADIASGLARRRAELVLLDRDGVLTEERGGQELGDALRLLPGSAAAVRRLNEACIKVCLVTNQAVVARGGCSLQDLEAIHQRLLDDLAAEGARLDGLFYCPHHPETHHAEGDPKLRGPCACRKPSVGLVNQALDAMAIPAWRAVVVGDASVDQQLATNAGLASIGMSTGLGCLDARFPAKPTWLFADLEAAASWLCGRPPWPPVSPGTQEP